ncbi:tail assembly protein [Paraburkholderia sp. J8-2]|uniref:tail assembly protein n=1 Tax=Paraburkholderia sp. J8-2 TaxID=2805440 RepID=UPI002AB60D5D|nr:tail assembly protein [Paraburkholderia sp. J8-2]
MLREVRLYGVAGSRFGRQYMLDIQTPREAVRALCVLIPGFRQFLARAKEAGLEFAVFIGRTNIGEDGLEFPAGREPIRIAPLIIGSKRGGIFQAIAGAVLTVVGAVMTAYEIPGGTQVAMLGVSMMLGGVMQMLSPQTGGLSSTANNGTSYYFDGPVNSSAQGEPVPIVYGEILAGSKVGSSGIYTDDQV